MTNKGKINKQDNTCKSYNGVNFTIEESIRNISDTDKILEILYNDDEYAKIQAECNALRKNVIKELIAFADKTTELAEYTERFLICLYRTNK